MQIAKDAFDHFKPLYPSFANFLNYIKDQKGASFIYVRRKDLTDFYFAQEIVQVFQPPPIQYMLKRDQGYYPKLIAFYPFERLYSDIGKIIIFPMTLKEARRKDKVEPTPSLGALTRSTSVVPSTNVVPPKPPTNEYKKVDGILIPKNVEFKTKKGPLTDAEYVANLKKSGEDKYPPELRHIYLLSGLKKTGTQASNIMSQSLKEARLKFLADK